MAATSYAERDERTDARLARAIDRTEAYLRELREEQRRQVMPCWPERRLDASSQIDAFRRSIDASVERRLAEDASEPTIEYVE